MKRDGILAGLLLLAFATYGAQHGDTPRKPGSRITTSTAGPQATKPAWQFTDDERFALRTNATLAVADSFDGKTHPELFLPHEVFRHFVGLAFEGDPRTRDIVR